jgi:hypothetical protein
MINPIKQQLMPYCMHRFPMIQATTHPNIGSSS